MQESYGEGLAAHTGPERRERFAKFGLELHPYPLRRLGVVT